MDNLCQAENHVLISLPIDRTPSEEEIQRWVTLFGEMMNLTSDERETLRRRVHAKVAVKMDVGIALVEEELPPWLQARKPDINPFYWNRFSKLLQKKSWPPPVITTVDRVTDDILDLLGDPARGGQWIRRGLVMGDVQSGKTSTYTALCCKAADAGYRLIILLTGTLENLRRQTQQRLDEGFVGLDSSGILTSDRKVRLNRAVGVGIIDARRAAGVFTSRSKDFNRNLVTSLGFRLDAFNEPVLLVVKKNKKILENLANWLKDMNAGADGIIDASVLMIDDEADNASVNTRPDGQGPTAINENIRSLLQLFTRSSYVGFTATPFANIYIDPESEDQMLGHDLFPRHFVYCLDTPSNYMGPGSIFCDEAMHPIVRSIQDADAVIPPKHTSGYPVTELPESLLEALRSFLLATTIRDLRLEGPTHRSMLVNVSRFTAVQDQVAGLLDMELRQIQQDIRNYSQLSTDEALRCETIRGLYSTWQKEFSEQEFDWDKIQTALLKGVLPIAVRAVNQRTGAASLDYEAYRETGLRVIAVGGNSLSRGLTLEGLSTSYFFRNSQMYDTLLQMGRWFGYRDGYSDLCRLWLTDDATHWYAHITLAIEELVTEIHRMRHEGRTPKDFGLKVRAHPDSLIVTARNKMRHARTLERVISVSGEGMETAHLRMRKEIIDANARSVDGLISGLLNAGLVPQNSPFNNNIWSGVPKKYVVRLLEGFNGHSLNFSFQPQALASFLDSTTVAKLDTWDIVVANGSEPEEQLFGISVKPMKRTVQIKETLDEVLVSGSSARVGSRGEHECEGIPTDVVNKIIENYKITNPGKNIPDKQFRMVREHPVLLVYPIRPYKDGSPINLSASPLVALGLSFPVFDDTAADRRVRYTVNLVEWQQHFESESEDDDVAVED